MKHIQTFEELNEGKMSPDKKIINSVLRKYAVKPLVYNASHQVRGWGELSGKGYKHEYGGYVIFKGIDKELIDKMAGEMKELGVDVRSTSDMSISYRES